MPSVGAQPQTPHIKLGFYFQVSINKLNLKFQVHESTYAFRL